MRPDTKKHGKKNEKKCEIIREKACEIIREKKSRAKSLWKKYFTKKKKVLLQHQSHRSATAVAGCPVSLGTVAVGAAGLPAPAAINANQPGQPAQRNYMDKKKSGF